MGISSSSDLASIHTRYKQFQQYDETKAKFMAELIASYEQMEQQCQALLAQRNEDRAWLQTWQAEKAQYDQLLNNAQRIMVSRNI